MVVFGVPTESAAEQVRVGPPSNFAEYLPSIPAEVKILETREMKATLLLETLKGKSSQAAAVALEVIGEPVRWKKAVAVLAVLKGAGVE